MMRFQRFLFKANPLFIASSSSVESENLCLHHLAVHLGSSGSMSIHARGHCMGSKTSTTHLRNAHRGQYYNGKVSPSSPLGMLDELGHDVLVWTQGQAEQSIELYLWVVLTIRELCCCLRPTELHVRRHWDTNRYAVESYIFWQKIASCLTLDIRFHVSRTSLVPLPNAESCPQEVVFILIVSLK